MKKLDLIGKRFGKLLIIKYSGVNKNGKSMWLCRCDCGNKKIILGYRLRSGNTKSCGCLVLKHNHSKIGKISKTYMVWGSMIQRCANPKNKAYKNYGERGITVCKRWSNKKDGFENFLKDIGEIPKGLSLDRIDNNKLIDGYSPANCKLSTRKEQARNRRNNRLLNYKGNEQCLSENAKRYNIGRTTLTYRLDHGYSIEEALTTPVRKRKHK